MNDDALNPNFEWKKNKGFGNKEKLSRRIDANQVVISEKQKKNAFTSLSLTAQTNVAFNHHLRKMRKKIKQALDDDEDDEENFIDAPFLGLEEENKDGSLFSGLTESEKKQLKQKDAMHQIKMQQDASKMKALMTVNAFAKKAGIPPLDTRAVSENIQNNGWGNNTFKTAVEHYIAPDIKTGTASLDPQKVEKLMKGLKRLQKIGGFSAVEGMKMNDIIRITDKKFNDEKVAHLLLKKTGRNPNLSANNKRDKKHHAPKISFKKLIEQKREQDKTFTKV